ncbi:MAG: class I SAM-dependent methyltransferase [Synechococcales bacterium]|nr:class I SAM-dependent methyltransferase [Synechococcales bacterium]
MTDLAGGDRETASLHLADPTSVGMPVPTDRLYCDRCWVDCGMQKAELKSKLRNFWWKWRSRALKLQPIQALSGYEAELGVMHQILSQVKSDPRFAIAVPPETAAHLPATQAVLQQVQAICGWSHYFESSSARYQHYWAAAMGLPKTAQILDVGSAPGHVGIGLYQLGYQVTGVNLSPVYRDLYPDPIWVERFQVVEHDLEKADLPFPDASFDAVFFTEILEHIAIRNPQEILQNLRRLLRSQGQLILSTPNICNLSSLYTLMQGNNVFWKPALFYGSSDRHNREYTPTEVFDLVESAGFSSIQMYGINSNCNWRDGTNKAMGSLLANLGEDHPFLRNTIMVVAQK